MSLFFSAVKNKNGVRDFMNLTELFILAIGLSMDAFAVSICKGLSLGRTRLRHSVLAGIYFGGFQALMPFIGYMLGIRFQHMIQSVDHWIAFVLLSIIGINMIKEAKEQEECSSSMGPREMFPLAVATSIDALAIGVTFAFLGVKIVPAVSLIGITTFILSAVGVKVGSVFGFKYKSKAEMLGGVVLILMGIKILIEHLGLLG